MNNHCGDLAPDILTLVISSMLDISLDPASPLPHLQGECDFLAANLYARSVFGEDALANVSLEKTPDGVVRSRICHRVCRRMPRYILCIFIYCTIKAACPIHFPSYGQISVRSPAISVFEARHKELLLVWVTRLL